MYSTLSRPSYYDQPGRMMDTGSIRRSPADEHWWNDGVPLDADFSGPLDFALKPLDPRSPEESDALPLLFSGSVPVFHNDLIALLQAEGVALDVYPLRLGDPDTGAVLDQYSVVNVLGLLPPKALGDFLGSLVGDHPGDEVGFAAVAPAPEPLNGLRLAWIEDSFTLVVHDSLQRVLAERFGDLLDFTPLDQVAV